MLILADLRYCDIFGFSKFAASNRMKIKVKNTIVEKWPFALKLAQGDTGFDDEFAMLLASGARGAETYMEWTGAD